MATRKLTFALLVAGLAAAPAAFAADAGGDMIGRTCAGCHGYAGVSKGAAPGLAGLPASYLEKALKDFKSEARPGTIMNRIAKGYTDAEIAAVAQYFGSLK